MNLRLDLHELRDAYYVHGYQAAANAAMNIKADNELNILREVFLHRCYIAQQLSHITLSEISDSNDLPIPLRAVRTLAQFEKAQRNHEDVTTLLPKAHELADELSVSTGSHNLLLRDAARAITASLFMAMHKYDEARSLIESSNDLDCKFLLFHLFLALDRPDMSERVVKEMNAIDPDDVLSQLCFAQLALAADVEKAQEAYLTLTEMIDKYSSTAFLLNLVGVAQMKLGRWEDASRSFLEAMEKSAKDPETLVNLIVCNLHMNKPKDVMNRYKTQLESLAPNHPWLVQLHEFEKSFDSACDAEN